MTLAGRVYDRALWGALGGLLGWLLFGVFGGAGAFVSGSIGYFVTGSVALQDRNWLRSARLAVYGLALGATAGTLAFYLSPHTNSTLEPILHWLLLGATLGAAEGLAARAPRLLARGLFGGALGGLASGVIVTLVLQGPTESGSWRQPLALILAGACIGIATALAHGILWPATVAVQRGNQAGSVYPLFASVNLLGCAPHVTVPLSDSTIDERHASIERRGDRFILTSLATPAERTRLNDEPLAGPRDLKSGDRIRLGDVELVFRARTARARRALEAESPGLDTVAEHPFDVPPFQGVTHVRELAARMQAAPHLAAPLLENGVVAEWFAQNNWGYPVRGSTAPGLAAVQQFFEAVGLAAPPAVALATAEAEFECIYPERLLCVAALQSTTRKWVFAEIAGTTSWLKVVTPRVSGAGEALIEYELDSILVPRHGRNTGQLHLSANGMQQLTLTVHFTAHRSQAPFTRRLLRPLLIGGLTGLVLRLLLALPGEWYGRLAQASAEQAEAFAFWESSPLGNAEYVRRFVLVCWFWLPLIVLVLFRRLPWRELLWSALAAAGAGLAVAATLACAVPVIDAPVRGLWLLLGNMLEPSSSWLWTPFWLLTIALWWAIVGAVLSLIARFAASRR